jgi:dipicolinate synthase subunit B
VPLIRLLGKQIGFVLPQRHATMDQIFREIEKLLQEGAEVHPLLLEDAGPAGERLALEKELLQLTGRSQAAAAVGEAAPKEGESLDLLVIAPCPGNMLAKILEAPGNPDSQLKALDHLQSDGPIVLALVANGNSGDLVRHIQQILAWKRIYLVPFGPAHHENQQFLITRMDLIKETVIRAFRQQQIQPVIFEHHWLPS